MAREARMEADRYFAPAVARRLSGRRLARMAGVASIDALWEQLAARPFPFAIRAFDATAFAAQFPDARAKIFAAAEHALQHRIDLLGTGPVDLGETIDWLKDVRTGDRWPAGFCRSIDYLNRGRPSDVKIPWEISRKQWLLPAGQAYLLSGEERYARAARDVIEQWIEANPVAYTVNWSCTMEPALRILSWTWLFHVFAQAESWADPLFRERFLTALYRHGAFTRTHIERSTINGNHLTADAAGLVFAGLFFGPVGNAPRWAAEGWAELEKEIELQVHPDGVDFEASSAYHRLVAELFLLPARYRLAQAMPVSQTYRSRLLAMGRFITAYSRPDGSTPHWGDADDGRAVPLGTQPLNDHRYLAALIGATFDDPDLADHATGGSDELAWHAGMAGASNRCAEAILRSAAFPDGGVYILRDASNHVFIDCGPVGLAGLGGHGHNDALSLEAWMSGTPLIVDPGSYVYTSSFADRNAFRSTAAHNTPQVDGEEINRLHSPDNLWNLHEDAKAVCVAFEISPDEDVFVGEHFGYRRLPDAVTVRRTVRLSHAASRLTIRDELEGAGAHRLSVPLHLAAGVAATPDDDGRIALTAPTGQRFLIAWSGSFGWEPSIETTRVSPSYGVAVPSTRIAWRRDGSLPAELTVSIGNLQT